MFKFKIISDGPHRRKRSSIFPEQQVSQTCAIEIENDLEIHSTRIEIPSTDIPTAWFDLGVTEPNQTSDE